MEICSKVTDFSIFGGKSLQEIHQEIQQTYLDDHRPWVIGYSGGKDSTVTLQLIWYALSTLPKGKLNKKVYVISSDTLVENPVIIDHITTSLNKINAAAAESNLPFEAIKVAPEISNSFWSNLIGKGYPAPTRSFRWCTDRLKIRPTNKFIMDTVSQYGEVIVVLGVRKSESAARSQVMNMHKLKGNILSRHTRFPQAFVYTPIENFTTEDVWNYLMEIPSPWGHDNKNLFQLYEKANAQERLFVIDDTTQATGNGRFGCWICTVVEKDKTMEALIKNGYTWLEPLNHIRNMLSETTIPENKHLYRSHKRLNGKVQFKSDGSGKLIYGPYKLDFCKTLLKEVLTAQKQMQESNPEEQINLISTEELHEIRRIWQMERGDWEDSLPNIYKQVYNEDLDWLRDDLGSFTQKNEKLLNEICQKHDVPLRLVTKLLDVEHKLQGMKTRYSIYSKINDVMSEDWRSKEEVLESSPVQTTPLEDHK